MMKLLIGFVLAASLAGCAPYIDRSEITVFEYACKDDGGIATIAMYPWTVNHGKCASGKNVDYTPAAKTYQESLKKPAAE